ncbi:MAG: insulinase family protein [Holosporales bacterium]|jgi:zinc protease|nr:insulinase family protein [Holosporales bacterium]
MKTKLILGLLSYGSVICCSASISGVNDGKEHDMVKRADINENVTKESTSKNAIAKDKNTDSPDAASKKKPSSKSSAEGGDTPRAHPAPKRAALSNIAPPSFHINIHKVKTALPQEVWFIPSDKPIVAVSVVFKDAGSKNFSKTHPSLGMFVSEMLGKGAGKYDKYKFQEATYDCGASFSLSIDTDHAYVSLWAPDTSYNKALELGAIALLDPKLPKSDLNKMKIEEMVGYEEYLQRPEPHLREALNKLFYPENHPYRASLERTRKDISQVSTDDIRNYLKFLAQNNAYVVVTGPKEKEQEIVAHIEKMLLQFPLNGVPTVSGTFARNTELKDAHIEFDVPQSIIAARSDGFDRKSSGYFAKKLAFAVVAQPSLHSMIFREIREKHGLAYRCYGLNIENDLDSYTYFNIGTKNESTKKAIEELKKLIGRVHENGISEEDFDTTKREVLGSLIVDLDSSSKFVGFVVDKRIRGFSAEQIGDYMSGYASVTLAEANAASKEIFNPNKLVFISIGKSTGE